MKRLLPILFSLGSALACSAQSIPAPADAEASDSSEPALTAPRSAAVATKTSHPSNAALQAALDRLTRSNQELLDLLKQQQTVLEDIQYDRRLQNRQISLLEQRLEDTLQLNATLQGKVAKLQAEAANGPTVTKADTESNSPAKSIEPGAMIEPVPAPPPASYLPAEQSPGAPGTMWWHRLLALSGEDSQNSKSFRITGKQWRVLWHNQDRPGDSYKNTSALFINAFPAGDSIPKKVCSQLGSGSDVTEMSGAGNFYLKVEASGGHWEIAIEDFR